MNNKINSIALKILSLVLSLMMVLGVIPMQGVVAYAADSYFCIQYLENEKVQKDVVLTLKTDENADNEYKGITDSNGVWVTPVTFDDLSSTFVVKIKEDAKIIEKSDEVKKYLIIDNSETSWSDTVVPVTGVNIISDNTDLLRGDTLTFSASVTGTPNSYQWYKNSQKIDGATSRIYEVNNVQLSVAGTYTCKVTDEAGNSRTSDGVTVKVSEKQANNVTLKAYAGNSEINGVILRNEVSKVELRVENLPDDASVADVAYYVNGNCVSSGTTETSYVFEVEAGVEEYTCRAEISFDKYYEKVNVELSAPIQAPLLSQSELVITVDGAEYDAETDTYNLAFVPAPQAKITVAVTGGTGDGECNLEIIDEKDTTGNAATGKLAQATKPLSKEDAWLIEINKAGTFAIKVTKEGDDNYTNAEPVLIKFNVSKATVNGFAFENEAPQAVTYNENGNKFSNPVVGNYVGDAKYSIEEGDCATVNEATGELAINKAGIVKVKATLAGSDDFEEATAYYTLTVNKAIQAIVFEENADTIYYGQDYSRKAEPVKSENAADGYGYNHDEGVKPEYSIVADGGESIATVAEDGILVFENQKTGTVTVKAILAGNDCYEAAEAEYTLTVEKYMVENAFLISGEQLNTESGWYTGDVTVIPAEGHKISKTNNLDDTNEWADSIVISDEGVENGLDIYLKNTETGAISEASTIDSENLKIDTTLPTGLKVNYMTSAWYEDVLSSITFGYYNTTVSFTLEAKDEISGIEHFVWKLISHEDDENTEPTVIIPETKVNAEKKGDIYESEVCILGDKDALEELRGKISFTVYDNAGHSDEYKDGYVIVIDTADPEVSIETDATPKSVVNNSYPYENADESAASPIEIYSDSVNVKFRVIEKNFFVQNATVSVNGESVTDTLSWKTDGDNHYATYEIEDDGDYSIVFIYEDIFGDDINDPVVKNKYEISKQISVDTVAPEVTVTLNEADFEAEGTKYYDETVTAEISVKEEKFNPADLKISEVEGFAGMSEENKGYLADSANWAYDEGSGIYTAYVKIAPEIADGNYAFTVDYSDLAGNTATQVESCKFVIDTIAPQTAVVSDAEATITVNNSYPYETVEKDAEGSVDIFNDNIEILFAVTEKNFFADRTTVTINGEAVSDLIWNNEGDVHTAKYTFNESGDYEIKLSYEDVFGNEVYESSDFIAVDKIAPIINVALSNENTVNDEFKYYNNDVTAVFTVEEIRFRPSELSVSEVEGFAGMSEENKAYLAQPSSWTCENDSYTASVVFASTDADDNYAFAVDYADLAGNAGTQAVSEKFVIDTTAPVISVDYGAAKILDKQFVIQESLEGKDFNNTIIFDDDNIIVTVKIDEINFDPEKVVAMLSADGAEAKEQKFDGEWATEGTIHTNTITISKEDTYSLAIHCRDRAFNSSDDYNSPQIVLSKELPSVSIEIITKNDDDNTYFSKDKVEVIFRVFDEYFDEGRVKVTATDKMATDIKGKTIALTDADIIPDFSRNETWTEGKNADGKIFHSAKIIFSTEARYSFDAEYENAVGSTSSANCSFVIDRTGPKNLGIKYSVPKLYKLLTVITFNYYNAPVTITLTAEDDISGVKKMDWKYTREAGASDINLESSEGFYEYDIAISDGKYIVTIPVTSDGGVVTLADLEQLRGNISLAVTDAAGNISKFGKDDDISNENGTDFDNTIIVDTISPTRKVEFNAPTVDANNKLYYNYSAVATVTITEANFYAEDVVLTINNVKNNSLKWVQNGDMWTTTVTLSEDGNYVIGLSYTDRSSNHMDEYVSKEIVVDTTSPVITTDIKNEMDVANNGAAFFVKDANFDASKFKLEITAEDIGGIPVEVPSEFEDYLKDIDNWTTNDNLNYKIIISNLPEDYGLHSLEDGIYVMTVSGTDFLGNTSNVCITPRFVVDKSSPINLDIKYSTPKLSKVISAVTFNYYNAPVIVTLIAEDSTSGVKILDWTYSKESGSSNTNTASDSGRFEFDSSERTATANIKLPNGTAEQYRGSFSFIATDRAGNISDVYTDSKTVVVVDTVAPTRTVEFSEPREGSFEEGSKAYYDSDAIATITITEANFYPEDVDLKVNDETYSDVNWTQSGDVWTGTVNFSSDGHYVLKLNYSDRSTNKMEEYVSGEIIVDEYDPVIEVSYVPDKEVYSSGDRKFYNEDQTATIKITEHNFDPKNVEVVLSAADIDGNAIDVSNIASQLANESAWNSNGDVHTATIKYSEDANYTFSISCTDPSGRKSTEYTPDEFTVDKSTPSNFSVDIRTDSISKNDTTEFYNAPVTVNVSAKDSTSGISEFVYSYTDSITGKTQTGKAVASSANGSNASATFKLPSETGEFKGTVKVVAIDNSGNKSNEYDNKKIIVVDSTAPEGRIELSSPVSISGGMSYYSGNVTATITIDETNFYSEDVNILVNGNTLTPGEWVNSGESWTTNVTVSADGEYKLSVEYTDKSGNAMATVESEMFMIDHTAPVIVVNGIKSESANNGEKIGFTLRAEDNNFIADGFVPVLEVVKKVDGGFEKEVINLSSAIASGNGYSIVVDNLTEDGIYTLTCVASDLCGNSSKVMTISDSNNARTEALRFSVNRNGSSYMIDEKSDDIVKKQYIQNVNGDIVITEVNVSPVTKYYVKLNGKELTEGSDFTVQKSGGGNEWYKNVYSIKAHLFETENEYNIVVNSVDETEASYYSDIKGAEVKFVVDTSAPIITVSGIEANGEYQTDKRMVTVLPTDDIGGLQMLRIITEDSNGELLTELFNAEGEALVTALEAANGMIELEIGEGINQTLRIICVDKAGNEYDSTDEFSGIRISSSKMTLLLTSTEFRMGVIAATVLIAVFFFFIVIKKKKKSKTT